MNRGASLFEGHGSCGECPYAAKSGLFLGKKKTNFPAEIRRSRPSGVARGINIIPIAAGGVGAWSDTDLLYCIPIRTGTCGLRGTRRVRWGEAVDEASSL